MQTWSKSHKTPDLKYNSLQFQYGGRFTYKDLWNLMVHDIGHETVKWALLTVFRNRVQTHYDVILSFILGLARIISFCGLLAHIQLTVSTADDSRWPIWTSKQPIEIIEALSTVPSRMLFLEHQMDMKRSTEQKLTSTVNCEDEHTFVFDGFKKIGHSSKREQEDCGHSLFQRYLLLAGV